MEALIATAEANVAQATDRLSQIDRDILEAEKIIHTWVPHDVYKLLSSLAAGIPVVLDAGRPYADEIVRFYGPNVRIEQVCHAVVSCKCTKNLDISFQLIKVVDRDAAVRRLVEIDTDVSKWDEHVAKPHWLHGCRSATELRLKVYELRLAALKCAVCDV